MTKRPAKHIDPRLPLPPVPTRPEQVPVWLELFRDHVEARRLAAELAELEFEAEKVEVERIKTRLEAAKAELELSTLPQVREKADLDAQRARIEYTRLVREEADTAASASNAMVYAFYREVDNDSVAEAVRTLDEWSRRNPGKPLEVQLTSPGGYVLDGLALYDFLRSLSGRGHTLTVTVFGFAASMGAVLLQAGDIRRIGANSFVMIHEVAGGAFGKLAEMEERIEFTKRLQTRLVKILCQRSKLTSAKVHEMWRKRDVWLDATEARRVGLVDVVVS